MGRHHNDFNRDILFEIRSTVFDYVIKTALCIIIINTCLCKKCNNNDNIEAMAFVNVFYHNFTRTDHLSNNMQTKHFILSWF